MVDYVERLLSDLVEQFKYKPVISALAEAVGEQLSEVSTFFEELKTLRWLHTAEGKQLDGIGDIVVLSRKEAGELASFTRTDYIIDDEQYKTYLIYKIWKNTCVCTYRDIIKAFKMFWDKPLYYSESIDEPATMVFETGELLPEDNAQIILNAPFVKPAGVRIHVIAKTVTPEMGTGVFIKSIIGRGAMVTVLPEIEIDIDLNDTAEIVPSSQNITQTLLPEIGTKLDDIEDILSGKYKGFGDDDTEDCGLTEEDIANILKKLYIGEDRTSDTGLTDAEIQDIIKQEALK
ncbi:MAG: DUF2612 domain-containing protein [Oscillospiraceae bacterium]|nr:DUF2612 domain-containing protein [Oscillospiraceae bacterium]